MNTFTELLTTQTNHMLTAAKRLDEKGYIVFIHGMNNYGERPDMPFRYFTGACDVLLTQWRDKTRRKVAIVHVYVSPSAPGKHHWKPFDLPFKFKCDLPRSRHLRPVVMALELAARCTKGRRGPVTGTGPLTRTELSNRFEFTGEGRDTLELVIRVLEMPMHRELLLRGSE